MKARVGGDLAPRHEYLYHVPTWQERRYQTPTGEVAACAVVEFELFYGVERGNEPMAARATILQLLEGYASFPFDVRSAQFAGQIRAKLAFRGLVIGPSELQIAGIALAQELTLVTHNPRQFARVPGLLLEDWEA
jgi:tRNA(fMet)-specific endonuclease VapC